MSVVLTAPIAEARVLTLSLSVTCLHDAPRDNLVCRSYHGAHGWGVFASRSQRDKLPQGFAQFHACKSWAVVALPRSPLGRAFMLIVCMP